MRHFLFRFSREVVGDEGVSMRRICLEIHCCFLFLKESWARKGILSGRLNLGTVALRKFSTRRSRARALDRQGCSMCGWPGDIRG